ncbi:MAG: hypothetical protein Q4D21_02300 [Phascolarctobacterium sp.]|nr:hypothetical protein [Phascolarctobacterium sp.]
MQDFLNKYDAVALMSGGLDSILAMRIVMEQGLKVLGLHFYSPFFGHPELIKHWEKIYGVELKAIDITKEQIALIKNKPKHGFGSVLNPCTDCHALMVSKAKKIMEEIHAKFIISGEVLWQRPMSQRPDSMNIVQRDSKTKGILLRPLSALWLEPTDPEINGLVDRNRLLKLSGRGRTEQLELAKKYGFSEIPMPGGGCLLTERKSSARFWIILNELTNPTAEDFLLAQAGRFFYHAHNILAISKNVSDANLLENCQKPNDYAMELVDYGGPLALGRGESTWTDAEIEDAASLMASYATKVTREFPKDTPLRVKIIHAGTSEIISVIPKRQTIFKETNWEETEQKIKIINKQIREAREAYKREKFLTWIPRKNRNKNQ